MVELLFLPSVYTECPDCHGARYEASTLEVTWRGRTIADVLSMSVEEANLFFVGDEEITRSLAALSDVGLDYLRLGQPATELSGGEAQRVKLAAELQRAQRGDTLYVLDEPTSGLHCADTDRLVAHLQTLVDAGNTVIAAELDMRRRDRGCSGYARLRRGQGRRCFRGLPCRRTAGSYQRDPIVTSVSLCDMNIAQRHTRRGRGWNLQQSQKLVRTL